LSSASSSRALADKPVPAHYPRDFVAADVDATLELLPRLSARRRGAGDLSAPPPNLDQQLPVGGPP